MNTIIQLLLKEKEIKSLDSILILTKETIVKINEIILRDEIHLIQILHSKMNTLLDFSTSKDYQILYFDIDKTFTGASYAINNVKGDLLSQTQSKWIILVPLQKALNTKIISDIEKFDFN